MDENISVAARETYERLRSVFGSAGAYRTRKTVRPNGRTDHATDCSDRAESANVPFGVGRDPTSVGDVLNVLTGELGWNAELAKSELIAAWPNLVGHDNAAKATPVGVDDGVLTVRCASTAWATQLRLMRSEILTRVLAEFGEAGISSIVFHGPGSSRWGKGPRSVGGRGPRDTYG